MPGEDHDISKLLFEEIERRHEGPMHWKKVAQDLLGLGKSALYNRLRGQTPLLLSEAIILANHFHISLDSLRANDHFIIARHSAQNMPKHAKLEYYLKFLLEQFSQETYSSETKLYFASNDLPIFYYALSPELFAFKLFAWGIAMPHSEEERKHKFSLSKSLKQNGHLLEIVRQGLNAYNQYPSVEIWPTKILENTLNQLEFYSRTHQFENPEEIELTYEALEKLIVHIFHYFDMGKKPCVRESDNSQELAVYYNEIIQVNSILLVDDPAFKKVYCVFDSPHFLSSSSRWLEKYTKLWFQYLMRSSSLLSENNMGLRNEVLEKYKKQIRQSRDKTHRILEL
ncbi:MAG TPA: hypothetical protein ENJ88_08925 [Phaeodactylibacter sp.]|nr:hypothetical protein [Phaeodactylibacter sp.]